MKTGIELIKEINECSLKKGRAAFWWLGQLGYIIKLGMNTIYIDIFLSDIPNRNIKPLLKAEEITNADFIIGSHDHIDHIDRNVWNIISKSSPSSKFVVPRKYIEELSKDLCISKNRFIGLDDCISIVENDLKITGIAASHEFLNQDPVTGYYPCLGYVLEGNGCTLYHSGDCCIYEGLYSKLKNWNKYTAMFIPINGRDAKRYIANCIGNMTYQEAVDLVGVLKPSIAIPGHYDMFDFNSENPKLFADYLMAKYPDINYWIGEHGQKVIIEEI